jgi:hypothetical protein
MHSTAGHNSEALCQALSFPMKIKYEITMLYTCYSLNQSVDFRGTLYERTVNGDQANWQGTNIMDGRKLVPLTPDPDMA